MPILKTHIFANTKYIISNMNNKTFKCFRFVLADTSLSGTENKLALIFFFFIGIIYTYVIYTLTQKLME